MAINWKLRGTVFQLLAAVYAELGEEAFKGRYVSIARYFGPDASYDAIKSFFAKEISKAASQLKAQNPDHRGSGRGVPSRCTAGPSRRPPHLYFDDEDISILTQREVEVVEARFDQSLRAPAKRPRVVKISPCPSNAIELISPSPITDAKAAIHASDRLATAQPGAACFNGPAGNSSHSTVQSDTHHTAAEDTGRNRKRPFSEIHDSIEPQLVETSRSSATPVSKPESFGYVTKQGQYRCALCLSQLPSQEDLDRHQEFSKEHLRNLTNMLKVTKGREKFVQAMLPPPHERHHSTPVPLQPLRINGFHEQLQARQNEDSSNAVARADQITQGTLLDTIEVHRRSHSSTPIQYVAQNKANGTIPTPQLEVNNILDKGKGRASRLAPPFPPLSTEQHAQPGTPSQAPSFPETRPTTARTEIGTLNTPHTVKNTLTAPQQPQDLQPSSNGNGNAPAFSANEFAEIMRSTELIVQLMGCVQREAKAVAESQLGSSSFESASTSVSNTNSGMGAEGGGDSNATCSSTSFGTLNSPTSSNGVGNHVDAEAQGKLQAPGIEVFTGMKRQDETGNGKRTRRKDTGDQVAFILLD